MFSGRLPTSALAEQQAQAAQQLSAPGRGTVSIVGGGGIGKAPGMAPAMPRGDTTKTRGGKPASGVGGWPRRSILQLLGVGKRGPTAARWHPLATGTAVPPAPQEASGWAPPQASFSMPGRAASGGEGLRQNLQNLERGRGTNAVAAAPLPAGLRCSTRLRQLPGDCLAQRQKRRQQGGDTLGWNVHAAAPGERCVAHQGPELARGRGVWRAWWQARREGAQGRGDLCMCPAAPEWLLGSGTLKLGHSLAPGCTPSLGVTATTTASGP